MCVNFSRKIIRERIVQWFGATEYSYTKKNPKTLHLIYTSHHIFLKKKPENVYILKVKHKL